VDDILWITHRGHGRDVIDLRRSLKDVFNRYRCRLCAGERLPSVERAKPLADVDWTKIVCNTTSTHAARRRLSFKSLMAPLYVQVAMSGFWSSNTCLKTDFRLSPQDTYDSDVTFIINIPTFGCMSWEAWGFYVLDVMFGV